MHKYQTELAHAETLRSAILGAPDLWLPRRVVLLEWLNDFLARVVSTKYELLPGDTSDLDALDRFLRKQKFPLV